jgi:predicted nucleic acid-binding protein
VARLFIDSNVFLYAIGAPSPYRESCRAVLAAAGEGDLDAVTSSEVLQELLHVRSRRLGMADATSAVRQATALVSDVLPVTSVDVLDACDLLEQLPLLQARDALHVAVMRSAGITRLISIDQGFDAVPGIERVDPQRALVG